jgi:hypothetical protein
MQRTHLHDLADQIAKNTGFEMAEEIYRAGYYSPEKIRNIIFAGQFANKPAVIKIYDDPRLTDESISQITFNEVNGSKKLRAPEVYAHEMISPQKGWLIMERLPEGSKSFSPPLINRKEFAELYYEYRTNFPTEPTRPLLLAEQLPAEDYHIFRISRWLEITTVKEAELAMKGEKGLFRAEEFLPRFIKAQELIRKEHKGRKMIWCHGHFKPQELFKSPGTDTYFLTDFAHTKLYPEGHELAFIIWADWLMSSDYSLPYAEWKKGIDGWIGELEPIAEKLGIKNYKSLITASITERVLGTLLADISGNAEWTNQEKEQRIRMLYTLLDDLLQ